MMSTKRFPLRLQRIASIDKDTGLPKDYSIEYFGSSSGATIVTAYFQAYSGATGPYKIAVPSGYDYMSIIGTITEQTTSMLFVTLKADDLSAFYVLATPNPSNYELPIGTMTELTATFAKVPSNAVLTLIFNFYNRPLIGIGASNKIRLDSGQIPLPVQTAPGDMIVDIDESSLPLWVTSEPTLKATPEMGQATSSNPHRGDYESSTARWRDNVREELRGGTWQPTIPAQLQGMQDHLRHVYPTDLQARQRKEAEEEMRLFNLRQEKKYMKEQTGRDVTYRQWLKEYRKSGDTRFKESEIDKMQRVTLNISKYGKACPEMFCCKQRYQYEDIDNEVYHVTTYNEIMDLITSREVLVVEPEMEGGISKDSKPGQGITEGSENVQASNVILGETQDESKDISSAPVDPEWFALATTEQRPDYSNLTDRWLQYKSFEWTTSQGENTFLIHDILPLAWLNSRPTRRYCDTPNFVPFNIHAYWRGDMEIKLQTNSNKFQNGMLLMSWLYAADSYDSNSDLKTRYDNVALQIQRPHVKVAAGPSNEATLKIPFRYVRPFLRCKNIYSDTVGKAVPLNMGRLTITPLVPLSAGTSSNAPKTCSCTLFIRLTKSKFTGLYDGKISNPAPTPAPRMLVAYPEGSVGQVVGKVLGVVDKVLGDVNCDDPPMTEPGRFLIPMNSQSWSHGTKSKEPIYTLRLDGRRIGVGRSKDIGYSETEVQRIVGVYGLLKPIIWSSTDAAKNMTGYQLWYMGVHPQCDKDKVYSTVTQGFMDTYTIPPVGVVSSCFCYWRGSLNFKFDIVATEMHTGRIMVAYIPGVTDGSKVTFAQAQSSANIVFSLNEGTRSFTFKVPYIAETMWWPRKYGGPQKSSDFLAPSTIVMYVVNKLVPMESVNPQVTILPYICAGEDFEVSILAQPSVGVGTNIKNSIPDSKTVTFKAGYYPVYAGEWRNWYGGAKDILRYGGTTDHVAQVTTPPVPPPGKTYYYRPRNQNLKSYSAEINGGTFPNQGNRTVARVPRNIYKLGYGVLYQSDGYNYMIPFPITNDSANPGETAAQVLAYALAKKQDLNTVKNAVPNWLQDSDYFTQDNITWEPIELDLGNNTAFLRAQPEMESTVSREETPNVMTPTSLLPPTKFGIVTYGESFHDIKDACRRYQLYWEGTISPGYVRANKRNAAFIQIPVLAQGLALDPTLENAVWNNMRDGHIPVLSSGFRFWRGGVRFRIVITGLKDSIWVQHHPDRILQGAKPIVGKNINTKDAYRNHAYAFHVQNLSVNRTIEVEVPYYRPGLYNLLGAPGKDFDSQDYTSIGDIVIGLEGDQKVDDPIDIAVYYSLADDCSFNVFCGFPTMVYCDEVFKDDTPPVPESTFEFIEKAQPEMLSTFVTSAASSVFGSLAGGVAVKGIDALAAPVARVVKKEVDNNIKPLIKDIENTVAQAAEDISSTLGRTLPQQAIISALGQFSQIALNPTPAAIGVAITTMVSNFVVISVELIITMQELLTKFLVNVWQKYFACPNDLQAGQVRAEAEGFFDEMNDKTLHGFLGLCFASVASTIGITVAKPTQFPNVMKGVKECLNVCNSSVVFFRNVVDSLVYMYKYCLGETSEELKAKIIIEREYPHMKDWCDEVMQLLDPRNVNIVMHSSRQANRVFDACLYGAKLIQENLDKNVPGGKVIYDLYLKICKLRDDLIELGNHPDIRFEAFPIWMCGPAGVGKSYMTQEICKEMLQEINYQTSECMIYWLALGQKYWNGIKNPPVIARDEAYAVGGQFTEEEIATHLAICSSSILNPPMAALSEKNKRLNPLIYYMNSNLEFPQINEARHPEAIYRRRKILARATYTPDILARYPLILDASELPPNEKENFAHLQFEIARDPKSKNTTWAGPYTYSQFLAIVKNKFVEHVQQERINFRHRMSAAYSLDPNYNPNDQLNYIHGTTLSVETLHEQYMREKNLAREILYTAPPTVEDDSYLSSILQRYAYLWTTSDTPQPEMSDVDEPSTSSGFYGSSQREVAAKICAITKMSRGSVLKLVSGNMIYSDEDIAEYIIDDHYSNIIKSRKLKMAFAVHHKEPSMLPDSIRTAWRQCAWNDSLSPTRGSIHAQSYIGHWEDLEGVEAIRSYTYWIMRQQQYKSMLRLLLEEKSKSQLRLELFGLLAEYLPEGCKKSILEAETSEDFEELFLLLDTTSLAQDQAVVVLFSLLYFLNSIVDKNQAEFCNHCRFWISKLHDTQQLEYNARFDTILYTNDLGLTVKFDNYCKCSYSFASNPLFLNSMRIIWNHDHGTIGHASTNPFSFAQYRQQDANVRSWLCRVWEYVKDWWRGVAIPYVSMMLTFIYEHFGKIVMVLLGLYALYSAYTHYNTTATTAYTAAKKVVQTTVEAATSYVAGAAVAEIIKEQPVKVVPEANYFKADKPRAAQQGAVPATREGVEDQLMQFENAISGNMCFIVASYNSQGDIRESWMGCLAIRERQLLIIKHYIEEIKDRPGLVLMLKHYANGKHCTSFLPKEVFDNAKYYSVGKDMNKCNFALLNLPKYVPMFKNILAKIVRKPNHVCMGNTGSFFNLGKEGQIFKKVDIPISFRKHLLIEGSEEVNEIEMDITYTYGIHGKGLCGSLLVGRYVCDGNPGIVGIHVAGLKGTGFAEPLYREMFEAANVTPKIDYKLPDLNSLAETNIELDSNVLMYGTVKKDYAHHESGKTKIIPSLLHGHVYKVLTEPNPLAPGDPRQPMGSHPLRDGCNKHGFGYSRPFPQNLIEQVRHDQRQVLLNKVKCPLVQIRELTLEEAICGSTTIPHCEAVNWKSSEGFPLSSLRPKDANNKRYLFDVEESAGGFKLKGIAPQLEALLVTRQKFRDKNVVFPPIYIDCLKDYRLTPAKCAIPGKTRIFSISPIQVTIDIRRYMGLFLSGYKTGFIDAQHGIGINPDSLDWTKLAQYLLEVGNNIVTGDYSNFGPSLSSQLVVESISDIIYWHEMNHAPLDLIRNLKLILENEIVNPLHLCNNLVYQTVNGIASGSPITAELNSEVNKYYIKLAFLLLVDKYDLKLKMEDFNAKVRLVTYGDDFIMSVHNDYISWFNLATIAEVLHEYGVILTDVTKGDEVVKSRPLLESSFLKRSFSPHPTRHGVYLAPIEEQSITECINWCHKQTDMVAATQEVVRASCLLAYGRGPQYYKKHTERIHKVALRFNIDVCYPLWEELDKDNFG